MALISDQRHEALHVQRPTHLPWLDLLGFTDLHSTFDDSRVRVQGLNHAREQANSLHSLDNNIEIDGDVGFTIIDA